VSTLAWWLIPVGATLLAIGWAAFTSRPRKPAPAKDAMEGLRRFGDAMERPLPDYQASDFQVPDPQGPGQRGSMQPGRRPQAPRRANPRGNA